MCRSNLTGNVSILACMLCRIHGLEGIEQEQNTPQESKIKNTGAELRQQHGPWATVIVFTRRSSPATCDL